MCFHVKWESRKSNRVHECFGCLENIPRQSKVNVNTSANSEKIWSIYFCERCVEHCKIRDCKQCWINREIEPGFIQDCRDEYD